jgi:hypothetical protein
MSLGVQIDVRQDSASPAVRRLLVGLQPAQINPIVGRSAQQSYKTHLFGVDQSRANKLGGKRTHFFASAARGTSFKVAGDEVVVSIASVGIRQRYFGGTIKPKKKYLTIPAIPEAHGKRASEFTGLSFAIVPDPASGRNRAALVQGARTLIRTRRTSRGVRVFAAGEQAQRVIFWLVKSVTQQPDPTILPYPEQVATKALEAAASYARLLADRANGGAS